MSRAADNPNTWLSLNEARRKPGWSRKRILDGIEAGRVPVRERGDEKATKLKCSVHRHDFDAGELTLWYLDPKAKAGEHWVTFMDAEVQLPPGEEVPTEPSSGRVTAKRWVEQAVKNRPRPKGVTDYAGWLLQYAPKPWEKKTIQNELARVKKIRPR